MREIKFRGKRVDNSEWVEGFYIYDDRPLTGHYIINYKGYAENIFEVIPETVGQFTGLKDKNGKEIYEGDVCNCREYECFGKVEWNDDEAGFFFCVVIEGGGFEEEQLYEYVDELEIIGSIYENPELMEENNG